jgi:hypothetical protein
MADAPELTPDDRAVLGAMLTLTSQSSPEEYHGADLVLARAMVKAKVLNGLIIRRYILSRPHPKTGMVQVRLAGPGLVLAYHCKQQRGY